MCRIIISLVGRSVPPCIFLGWKMITSSECSPFYFSFSLKNLIASECSSLFLAILYHMDKMLSIVIFMLFFNIILLHWNILRGKPKQKHPFFGLEAEFSPRILGWRKILHALWKTNRNFAKKPFTKIFLFFYKFYLCANNTEIWVVFNVSWYFYAFSFSYGFFFAKGAKNFFGFFCAVFTGFFKKLP